ncbi:hypothetical protein BGZ83_001527 [Gryganskiella cystojenkinii]|nr:hypothetical protein BGZ83_001527 [Gryganskiella cystojenkinii]
MMTSNVSSAGPSDNDRGNEKRGRDDDDENNDRRITRGTMLSNRNIARQRKLRNARRLLNRIGNELEELYQSLREIAQETEDFGLDLEEIQYVIAGLQRAYNRAVDRRNEAADKFR